MDNPFLEEKTLIMLLAPAYIWKLFEAGSGASFGLGEGTDPVPRGFYVLTDGLVAVTNPQGDDIYFQGKAGMNIPAAITNLYEETTAKLLIYF